ncbi:MAG: hypothetical protein GY798_20150 [Hyphomicrobiales bacterium]|nr:hypothetical protein [Hyphomicrobiales bacterium]
MTDADCALRAHTNDLILRCEGGSPSLEERTASPSAERNLFHHRGSVTAIHELVLFARIEREMCIP